MPPTRLENVSQAAATRAVAAAVKSAPRSAAHSMTAKASPRLCMEDRLLKGFVALQQEITVEKDDDGFVWDFKPPSLRSGARSSTASTLYRQSMTSPSGKRLCTALYNEYALLPSIGSVAPYWFVCMSACKLPLPPQSLAEL